MAIWDTAVKKTIFSLVIIALLYTLAGFFAVPLLGQKFLPEPIGKALNRDVSFDKLRFNPFLLSLSMEGLTIKGRQEGTLFFSSQKINARINLKSIIKLAPVISDILVQTPELFLVREKDNRFNFSDLLEGKSEEPVQKPDTDMSADKSIPGFVLENVKLADGSVLFEDKKENVSHKITGLSFMLPYLSSKPDDQEEKATVDMDFVLNQSRMDIHIQTTPFAEHMATRVLVKTEDINVVHYQPYLMLPENVSLKTLDINTDIETLVQKKSDQFSVELQGKVNLNNFDLADKKDSPAMGFESLSLDILQSDVLAGQLNLGTVRVTAPRVSMVKNSQGKLNLVSLFETPGQESKSEVSQPSEKSEKPGKSDTGGKPPFQVKLVELALKDGKVDYSDLSLNHSFKTTLFPVTAKIKNLSAGESVTGDYSLAIETEAKEKIGSEGTFSVNPVFAKGSVSLSDLKFNKYEPYYETAVDLIVKSGTLSTTTEFDIKIEKDDLLGQVNVSQLMVKSLALLEKQSKENLLELPMITVTGSKVDLAKRLADIGTVKIENGAVDIKRYKDGNLNLAKAFSPGKPTAKSDQASSDPPQTAASSPWGVSLPELDLTGMKLKFTDLSNSDPVNLVLSRIAVKATGISTQTDKTGNVSVNMKWNKDGKIAIKGKVLPSKMQAELDLGLDKIDIKSVQPYFTDAVKVVVTNGDIHTHGSLDLDFSKKPDPSIRFKGKSSVTGFVCLDKKSATDFFKAKSFYLAGLDVSVFPVKVAVKDISLTDFYSRIIVSKTGEMNLKSIFKDNENPEEAGEKAEDKEPAEKEPIAQKSPSAPAPEVVIENVTLQGGDIQFSDYLTRPNFTAVMKALAGSVKGLSSQEGTRAKLHMKGIHGQSSPLEIVGSINPLAQKKFADIDFSFKDIELTKFTPYTSKYLGYKIEKGKLVLDLEYMIDGNTLRSENRVRFDNFALGEAVDSEDATSLPVSLAISLLKDSNGQINLDLPVKGELDDPEFSIGGVVLKMIGNLIVKVVTSPFSIIGSMFGGGEELEYLEFKDSGPALSQENIKKIDQLTQILVQKPSINLEIKGLYNSRLDEAYLGGIGFLNLIKVEKIKQLLEQGEDAPSLEDVVISEEEMPVYIYLAYTKSEFPKPMDDTGTEKEVDLEEKKKLLMTHIPVTDDDLRHLSMQRAENVKAYILSTTQEIRDRIFILEPEKIEESENDVLSRVKFSLK